ncbi:MAG: hypothetical protein EXS35_05035 [Pedosphaera sp.]|nr:hypothetical protein [Pedosphaera sp.]
MNHKKIKLLAAAMLAVWLPAMVGSAADTNTSSAKKTTDKIAELFGDATVAKGVNLDIKRSQLDSATISIKANAAAQNKTYTPDQTTLLELQILERMIQIQLLVNKATDADRAKGKETAAKQFEVILQRAGSEEALARQLKSVGLNADELRVKMADEATAQTVADRELNVVVSEDEAKKYYDEHPASFEEPEMVRASHILLTTFDTATRAQLPDDQKQAKRKLADDLLKRARAGEDFAKLVKDYTEDSGSRETGGEYKFPRASADPRRAMQPEFESAAFALYTNQISDVVTTTFGYHIIKLSEKIPARKLPLTEVSTALKDGLKRQQTEKLLPDYIEKMEKDAKVEILDEKLKKLADTLDVAKAEQKKADAKKAAEKPEEKQPEAKKPEEKK